MSDPVHTQAPFWQDAGGTPLEILDRPPGLRAVFSAGVNKFGDTTTVRVEYAIPDRHERIYGGRARSAINVVAINLNTGELWYGIPTSSHAVSLSQVMNVAAADPPDVGMDKVTTAASVNIDVGWMLPLPPDRASYAMFVWADEFVTNVHRAALPRADARPGVGKNAAKPPLGTAVTFQSRTAAAGARLLTVESDVSDSEKRMLRGMVSGPLLSPEAFKDGRKPILTIIVLDFLTRQIGYESVFLPDKADQQVFSFTANLETILKTLPGAGEGRIFVIAHVDGTVSAPLAFEPPKKP